MNKLITLVFISCFTWVGNAQILDNSNCNLFTENNFFNREFIAKNKVKSIRAEVSLKRELKPIIPTNKFELYTFDINGKLLFIKTANLGGFSDTATTAFQYSGYAIKKQTNTDKTGYYSYSYEYDKNKKRIKKTYSREEKPTLKSKHKNGEVIVVYSETYSHEKISDKQAKKTTFNSSNKPYLTTYFNYDKYDNLTKEISTLVVTKKGTVTTISYDEYHRPAQKTIKSNVGEGYEERYEYQYDEHGNILKERYYENDIHKTSREYLYNGKMLLTAKLTKNEATQDIEIVKYSYSFW